MRRRIYLGGTAITAASLALFVGTALAASPSKPTTKTVVFKCHINLTTGAPPGQQAVDVPPSQGTQYGPAHCGQFGGALQADSFKVPDSGDMVGGYAQYFLAGTIHGKFDLQPLRGFDIAHVLPESGLGRHVDRHRWHRHLGEGRRQEGHPQVHESRQRAPTLRREDQADARKLTALVAGAVSLRVSALLRRRAWSWRRSSRNDPGSENLRR